MVRAANVPRNGGNDICGDCGGYYGSKVWGSNTKYRRNIWRCNDKYKGEEKCQTPHFTEEDLKTRFLGAFTKLMGSRDELIANIELAKTVLCDCHSLNIEIAELQNEMEIVAELSRKAIFENAHTAMDQEEFNARNDSYLLRHRLASEKITELENQRRERYSKALLLDRFISEIRSRPLVLSEFDVDLWTATIDSVTVTKDDKLIFEFKDGSKIEN